MALIDRAPSGLLRAALRAPVWLYRLRLGWLMGSRFLLLEHTSRRTGVRRKNVLEVVGRDRERRRYFVAAAWGERSQWYRNVRAEPTVRITVGRECWSARAERVSTEEAADVLSTYKKEHSRAWRELTRLFGTGDIAELSRTMPVLRLRREA